MMRDKEKQKIADAKYYANNKEKVKAKVKEYYEANKDKVREQKQKWYEANKPKIKEQQKAYRKSIRDYVKVPIIGKVIKDKKLGNKVVFNPTRRRREEMKDKYLILLCALRYALGRRSYIVEVVANYLINEARELPLEVRGQMIKDIKEADDLGGEIDKVSWQQLLEVLKDLNPPGGGE